MVKAERQVLSNLARENFVGRERELEEILRFAREEKAGRCLLVMSTPLAGSSELLRQAFDILFHEKSDVFPFYFEFNRNDKTPAATARRFLRAFLQQAVAFRRNDAKLLGAATNFSQIAGLAAPSEGVWIDRLISASEDEARRGDLEGFVRQALSAPLRAASSGAKSFLIFDDFHEAGAEIIEQIKQIYARSTVSFVVAGRRRFLPAALQNGEVNFSNTSALHLSALSASDAGILVEKLAVQNGVKVNEQTRDLIVRQFEASPAFISNLIHAARDRRIDLDSFKRCEQIYTAEILGGRIGRYFKSLFDRIVPNPETQREIVGVLQSALASDNTKSSIEFWRSRVSLESAEFYRIMRELHLNEIVRLDSSAVETAETSEIARDYVGARHSLETKVEPRALVVAETLANSLKRAPELMARFYRRNAALGLRELLKVFNLQEVPAVLFDYARFRRFYRGSDDRLTNENLASETDRIELPQIVYAANCAEFYPSIERIADAERSAVAVGFEAGNYADESQIVWIAAEIESKLEAAPDVTEFWLDRLEAVAVFCNFDRARFWLIAPEGFSEAALQILKERGAFSSSKRQFELLAKTLAADAILEKKSGENPNQYEFTLPMGEDTELIAAHTAEEIARRGGFKPAAINQIKTAVVEACINAAEHSLSPERKIYQKFALENDKLVITVANRGLQIPREKRNGVQTEENSTGRRGFGLRLIRGLMDEVEFIRADDGTQIRMTKRK